MTVRLEADAVFTVDSADTVLGAGRVEIDDGVHFVGRRSLAGPARLRARRSAASAAC